MISLEQHLDIIVTEAIEGVSHQCSKCGTEFLANEDKCPICGSGFIQPLNPFPILAEVDKK